MTRRLAGIKTRNTQRPTGVCSEDFGATKCAEADKLPIWSTLIRGRAALLCAWVCGRI